MPKAKGPVRKNQRANTIDDREIGLRIRAIRIDQGLSQEEVASKLGVSFQQVQKYEKGSDRIAASRLMKIAVALQTTPHKIMGWDGESGKLDRVAGNVEFDVESYRLAKVFAQLPDRTKPAMRNLINAMIRSAANSE